MLSVLAAVCLAASIVVAFLESVQFGVIMIMCSMVGLLTPPVGMVLFAVSSIADISVARLSRALMPYLLGLCMVLLAVVTIPAVSIWLPSVLMGGQ